MKNETLDPDIPRRSYKVPSRFDYFLNNSARHSTLIVQIWIVSSAVIQERSFSRQQPFRPSNGRFLTPTLQLRKWHQAFHAIHDSKYKEQIDDSQLKCEGKNEWNSTSSPLDHAQVVIYLMRMNLREWQFGELVTHIAIGVTGGGSKWLTDGEFSFDNPPDVLKKK